MNQHKPRLLLYCQHSLGMGHWVRAMTLANALSREFRVTFLNGGRAPDHQSATGDLDMLNLPPLGMGEDHQLYSQDDRYSVKESLAMRRQLILDTYALLRPEVVLIELFPFGRKKLAGELLPLLKAARRDKQARPLVLCSLRDIMVNARKDQSRHDERARWITDRYFDGLLVHADPRFARLEDSFHPRHPLKTPLLYTGFVAPGRIAAELKPPRRGVLVSAGGGMVGAPLFQVAVQAHAINWAVEKLPMTIVAGPFLPEADWQDLAAQVKGIEGLTLLRSVPAMQPLLEAHSLSVSQCGYNTVMDILESRTSALVVPFVRGQEDEQSQRAQKLAQLGLVKVLNPAELTGQRLAEQILQLRNFSSNPAGLDLSGADHTVRLIQKLLTSKQDANAESQPEEYAHAC
ncbi:glycosyltransferase family protein [Methylomonas sp. HW2-6]|uniref:glycosyltransferase family protein n=1 Tax=Methylomonas sp. HW2-6 TaxID=3376687 RepID=UPI004041195F